MRTIVIVQSVLIECGFNFPYELNDAQLLATYYLLQFFKLKINIKALPCDSIADCYRKLETL